LTDRAISFDLSQPWEATGPSPTDALLIEGLRAGEEVAYEELVRRFQTPVYNLVYRLLDDPIEAGDVVQEVFLKVFRNVTSFRGDSSLKTWIYRIGVNEAHNHRRWFHRRRGPEISLEDDQGDGRTYEQVLADQLPSPLQVTMEHETQVLIEEALQKVRPVFREALILRDLEGLSYEEVASVLQVSLGTVKSRIVRGREALKQHLSRRLEDEPRFSLAVRGVNA